ncbi:MAG: LLM class F420-dependent oxidoreductase [Ilumatobacteraceae bacterium]|nr:LLM class F420-dependent oxidoreductase [Ilumatobacteraceae bacterium]
MKIGVQIWPQATTVKAMRNVWRAADDIGVDSLWTWDHFYPLSGDPEAEHFECYTLLAAMAADTKHATIGALVTCYSYRNAQLLADMARTIDHISEGRFILGIGSGWFERDYKEYGYEFGTGPGRLKLLEAGLPVIKERMSKLNPGPVNGKIPLMIGGSGERVTLRLVAQYADQLNTFGPPENFKRKNDILNEWCTKVGRNPKDIERTVAVKPEELEKVSEYAAAGADHMIVMLGQPFDLSAVEKYLASTR